MRARTNPCAAPTPKAVNTVIALSSINESRRQPRRNVRIPEYCSRSKLDGTSKAKQRRLAFSCLFVHSFMCSTISFTNLLIHWCLCFLPPPPLPRVPSQELRLSAIFVFGYSFFHSFIHPIFFLSLVASSVFPSPPQPGCSSPFMRLAEHLTALGAWCKQYLPGW